MIKHATIQDKRIDSERTVDIKKGPRKGQTAKVYNCSLKINDKWYKGSLWDKSEFEGIGEQVYLVMFQKEWQGVRYWNWKLAGDAEILQFRVEHLEKQVDSLLKRLSTIEQKFETTV